MAGVVLVVGAVALGVLTRTGSPDPATPPAPDRPVDRTDVSALPIEREPFCDLVDDQAVPTALGLPVARREHYTSGDRVRLGERRDVSHEYGCVFGAGDGEARAWVFVPPVSPADARRLVDDARRDPACTFPSPSLGFGRPGLTSVCERGKSTEVTHAGLFGDAWLTCRLTVPGTETLSARARADRWCLHVVTTLGARP